MEKAGEQGLTTQMPADRAEEASWTARVGFRNYLSEHRRAPEQEQLQPVSAESC